MVAALYDRIGKGYDTTRCADPYITGRLAELLAFGTGDICLDLACGSGNYTTALASHGGTWYGIDASTEMIDRARGKTSSVHWTLGDVAALPFDSETFDRTMCTLAIHHFPAPGAACAEVYKVLRPGGRFVLFTALPEQMERYWLRNYFPKAMDRSIAQMPSFEHVAGALRSAGFSIISTEPYEIQPDIQDLFLYSGKHRPELYLDPTVRAGISTFAALADEEEIREGCLRLEADIKTGRIHEVAAEYIHDGGDYLFIVAHKE